MLGGSLAGPASTKSNAWRKIKMSEEDIRFLNLIHEPELRANLLARLERLGLLSAFLEIESETIPESACPCL